MPTALELMRQKRQQVKSGSDGPELVKLPMGDSKWRVLPCWRTTGTPERPMGEFALAYREHWIKHPTEIKEGGSPGDKKILSMIPSVKDAYGEDCPIGGMINSALTSETDPDIIASLEEAQGSVKYLMNLYCVDGPHVGQVVQMAVPMAITDVIFATGENDTAYNPQDGSDPTELEPFTVRPDKGVVFKFNRSGAGRKTKYKAEIALGGDMAPELLPVSDEILSKMANLDDIVTPSSEDVNRALQAMNTVLNPHGVKRSAIEGTSTNVTALNHKTEQPSDNDFDGAINVKELGNTEGEVDPLDALMAGN